MTISTERLDLVPYCSRHLFALVDGYDAYEASFGLPAAAGLRDFVVSDEVSEAWVARLRETESADPWVHGFAIVHRESRSVIGVVGFKGPPDASGMVEIAYGIVPGFERQGYATEAARAGAGFALANRDVRVVRAHTLPVNLASARVLGKCGFRRTGEVHDPADGTVWRFELHAARSAD